MPDRNPSIDDVASAAGVARATVSRVINENPNVSAKTRQRVVEAIEKLGYSVNQQARALASGSVRRIILFHAGSPNREPNSYYDAGLELGALRACSGQGLDLASRMIDPDQPNLAERMAAIITSEKPMGVILPPPLCDDAVLLARLDKLGMPVSAISAAPDGPCQAPSVGIDDYAAGRAIARHLIALGHRRLGFLSGPLSHKSAAKRLDGFRDELATSQLEPAWIAEGDFTFRSGIEKAHELLESGAGITALACANDDMAAGAMLTFHREGMDLPRDLSITGFDDTPVSQIVWPPLTTIRQPIQAYGEQAVAMLIARPSQNPARPRRTIPFELVVRESSSSVSDAQRTSA